MIRVITGAPGSGKSLRTMWWLQQPEYLNEDGTPRPVYSNIPGTDHLPLPEGEDWTQTPDGSIVIYDEAQKFFPSTGRAGNSTDPRIQALEVHRHTGHDLFFLTQRYALIHHHIRGLAGNHEHLLKKSGRVRPLGLFTLTDGASVIFSAGEVFDPKDRWKHDTITESVWNYPSQLFDEYISSSQHTKAQTTNRIPTKFKFLGVAILALGAYASWAGWQSFHNVGNTAQYTERADQGGDMKVAATNLANGVTQGDQVSSPRPAWQKKGHEGLSGCVASDAGCQCFDHQGLRVDLPEQVCRNEISQPMVSRITGFDSRGGDRKNESQPDPS